jgi:hypothetical protein
LENIDTALPALIKHLNDTDEPIDDISNIDKFILALTHYLNDNDEPISIYPNNDTLSPKFTFFKTLIPLPNLINDLNEKLDPS